MPNTFLAPTADELRAARDILRRKAAFDLDLAREAAEVRSDYTTFDAYRERAARLAAWRHPV